MSVDQVNGNLPTKLPPPVIVTRPIADAKDFGKALAKKGYNPVFSPVIKIVDNTADLNLSGVAAVAFTSANGVRAFCAKTEDRNLPAFAVGAATASILKASGFTRVYVAGGDVDSLAQLIREAYGLEISVGVILHVAGTHRTGDLAAALKDYSIPAQRAVLYEACPAGAVSSDALIAIEDAKEKGLPLYASFFSPRSAQLFCQDLVAAERQDAIEDMIALCLSARVADAARDTAPLSWRKIRVAEKQTAGALLDLLSD